MTQGKQLSFLSEIPPNKLSAFWFKYLLISSPRHNAEIYTLGPRFSIFQGESIGPKYFFRVIDCHNQTVVSSSVMYVLLLAPDGAAAVGLIMATDGGAEKGSAGLG